MHLLRTWWNDRLLRNVLANSSYLFSSNSATIILGMVQGILAARLLGDGPVRPGFGDGYPFRLHRQPPDFLSHERAGRQVYGPVPG